MGSLFGLLESSLDRSMTETEVPLQLMTVRFHRRLSCFCLGSSPSWSSHYEHALLFLDEQQARSQSSLPCASSPPEAPSASLSKRILLRILQLDPTTSLTLYFLHLNIRLSFPCKRHRSRRGTVASATPLTSAEPTQPGSWNSVPGSTFTVEPSAGDLLHADLYLRRPLLSTLDRAHWCLALSEDQQEALI